MNILSIADNLSGLFPKKVSMKIRDIETGQLIEQRKIKINDIIDCLDRPSTITIDQNKWFIISYAPLLSKEIIKRRELEILVVSHESRKRYLKGSEVPTIAGDWHTLNNNNPKYTWNWFQAENWRQVEFLKTTRIEEVQSDIKEIDRIINNKESYSLLGYSSTYHRLITKDANLSIKMDDFSRIVSPENDSSFDIISFQNHETGFSIQSEAHRFYGICSKEFITTLCLEEFDGLDDELSLIMETYQVMLVDWCNCKILA